MIAAMLRALAIALLFGLVSTAAAAQTTYELSGGYSMARDPRDDVTLPAGWTAGAGIGLTRTLSAVADVSAQYKTVPFADASARLSVVTAMGGARAAARIGPLTEFAQVLAGVVRASGSAFGATSVDTSFAVQPGAGIDYPLRGAFALRAQLDVRFIRSQTNATNAGYQVRFAAGVVYRR